MIQPRNSIYAPATRINRIDRFRYRHVQLNCVVTSCGRLNVNKFKRKKTKEVTYYLNHMASSPIYTVVYNTSCTRPSRV